MLCVLQSTVSMTILLSTHNICFWLRNKKNNFKIHTLIWRPETCKPYFSILLITFANSLELDQAQLNVGSDLDPNSLTLCWYSCKVFIENFDFFLLFTTNVFCSFICLCTLVIFLRYITDTLWICIHDKSSQKWIWLYTCSFSRRNKQTMLSVQKKYWQDKG